MADSKICNILCSGPRRKSFVQNGYTNIAVNIPWTNNIEYMVFSDTTIPPVLLKYPDIVEPQTKLIIGPGVIEILKGMQRWEEFRSLFNVQGMYKFTEDRNSITTGYARSSGHYACEFAIGQGFTELNIYGCDNWFGDRLCIDNWSHKKGTRHYIPNDLYEHDWEFHVGSLNDRADFWLVHWKHMVKKYHNVKFNFIP